jgi:hypothetical protein
MKDIIYWFKTTFNLLEKPGMNIYDCPCSDIGCCSKPDVFCPKHTCIKAPVCEECYMKECRNCGMYCCCELLDLNEI